MSYKTFKKLLGETSLERKCRFLFGGGLMLLISGSFYFYAQLNGWIIRQQNVETARMLVSPIVVERHLSMLKTDVEFVGFLENLSAELKPDDVREEGRWTVLGPNIMNADSLRATDEVDLTAFYEVKKTREEYIQYQSERYHSGQDQSEQRFFRYYAPLIATEGCIACHKKKAGSEGDELLGMVKIVLPLRKTESTLAWNNAILLAMAIVTSFCAMIAAYAIVRYVIVKPVLHLKDISNEIAHGKLDLRADIRTGDEFEELSHAFNRMLRSLSNAREELVEANEKVNGKVEELAQANLSLYELNNLKNDFLATMSHELRTPLNSILGFSDLLDTAANLNEKQHRYLKNITASGKHLLALINDILELAKIESGKMEVRPVEFSMSDLVGERVDSIRPLAERKNIDVICQIAPDLPMAFQDYGKLQQILNNLLSNAVKFTPEGGQIRINVKRLDTFHVSISVEDNGIGIPLEDQELIFEKFRQGRGVLQDGDNLKREFEGTGLGLSIVRELCRLLEGEIRLHSEFGKGSTFTVSIPIICQAYNSDSEEDRVRYQTIERTRQKLADYNSMSASK